MTLERDENNLKELAGMKVIIIPWLHKPLVCTPEMAEKIKKKYSELTDLIVAARESTRI